MPLYLIRHGQTAWNTEGRAQGHTDVDLDELGYDQARMLADAFITRPVDYVLTSDLKRAKNTGQLIADRLGVNVEIDTNLRERSFGDWEGESYAEVGERFHKIAIEGTVDYFDAHAPNGESMRQVWNRLAKASARLFVDPRNIVVVSHGGSTALLLSHLIQGKIETARGFRFSNTGVTTLDRRKDGSFFIDTYNDTRHLVSGDTLSGDLDGTHH